MNLTSTTVDQFGNKTTLLQQQRPFPQFNSNPIWSAYDRYGSSNYNGFYLSGRQQAAYGVTFLGNFSWSKSLDNSSSSVGAPGDAGLDTYGLAYPQGYGIGGDYALSLFDIPAHLATGYDWKVPVGRGKNFFNSAPGWVDQVIGGWSTAGMQIFQSGYPLFITASSNGSTTGFFCSTASGGATCGNGNALNDVYLRPNRVPGVNPIKSNWKRDPYGTFSSAGGILNPAAWSYPGAVGNPQFGNGRRTTGDVRNPRSIFWNASLRKECSITPERVKLQLYTDIVNLLNHSNYYIQGNRFANQGVYTNSLATTNGVTSYSANPSFGLADSGVLMRTMNLGVALTF